MLAACGRAGARPGRALRRKVDGGSGPGSSARCPATRSRSTSSLGQQLAAGRHFRDETGKTVQLGDYFGKQPAILSLVYYQCQILCTEELNGLVGALEMVNLTPGKTSRSSSPASIPARPGAGRAKKAIYVKRYGRPETANGWHFLTGPQPVIAALAKAVGFGYVRVARPDGKLDQFAHASSIEVVTPEADGAILPRGGVFAQGYQLGLVEASHNRSAPRSIIS